MQAISRYNPVRAAPVSEVFIHTTSSLRSTIERGTNYIGDPGPRRASKATLHMNSFAARGVLVLKRGATRQSV
jgi:hypothetical protein